MATQSIRDFVLALIGWYFIISLPFTYIIRISSPGFIPSYISQLPIAVFVAIPAAYLYWAFEKPLWVLGEFFFTVVILNFLVGVVVFLVLATFEAAPVTESIQSILLTVVLFCITYTGAYYLSYGDGYRRFWVRVS